MNRSSIFLRASLLASMLLASAGAGADIIYGSAATGGIGPLTRYDTDTDTTTDLASLPGNLGLSFDASGVLYAIQNGAPTSTLYTLDLDTGVATTVGTADYSQFVESLAINSANEAYTGASAVLYQVNLNDGSAVQLGAVAGMSDIDGLSFNPVAVEGPNGTIPANTLFANDGDDLFTIDIGTLTATPVQIIGGTSIWESISFASDGTLYVNTVGQQYNTVDLLTGAVTLVGGPSAFGMAVQPEALPPAPTADPAPAREPYVAVPVPADNLLALLALMLAMAGVGAFALRR